MGTIHMGLPNFIKISQKHRQRTERYLDSLLTNQPISDNEATDHCQKVTPQDGGLPELIVARSCLTNHSEGSRPWLVTPKQDVVGNHQWRHWCRCVQRPVTVDGLLEWKLEIVDRRTAYVRRQQNVAGQLFTQLIYDLTQQLMCVLHTQTHTTAHSPTHPHTHRPTPTHARTHARTHTHTTAHSTRQATDIISPHSAGQYNCHAELTSMQ